MSRTSRLFLITALFSGSALYAQRGPEGPGGGGILGRRPSMGMGFRDHGPNPTSVPSPPPRIAPQLGLPGRWWDDKHTMKLVGLRSEQQKRMDAIFEINKPTLATLYGNLQHEEARLMALPPGDLQDETKIFAAIDRVAEARTELEKEQAHILLLVRQQMEPEQLAVLDREIASSRDVPLPIPQ